MKIAFGKKKFNQYYLVPGEGQFALEAEGEKPLHWDHCREQFLGKFKENIPGFYFSHKANIGINIAGFLLKFEEIIKIEIKDINFSIFRETEKETVLWVEPSNFWRNCILKKSLMTLLLRCGFNYDNSKDNFDNALFGVEYNENKYARETKNAIIRFLFGFTEFTQILNQFVPYQSMGTTSTLIRHGWHAEFEGNSISDVRKKLISHANKFHEISLIDVESIWGK